MDANAFCCVLGVWPVKSQCLPSCLSHTHTQYTLSAWRPIGHTQYILSVCHPIGHTHRIFSVYGVLLVTHTQYFFSVWRPIVHTHSIFSVSGVLLVTHSVYSQCLASYWSHPQYILSAWRPIGHTHTVGFSVQEQHAAPGGSGEGLAHRCRNVRPLRTLVSYL
jgi:hypothetical protein